MEIIGQTHTASLLDVASARYPCGMLAECAGIESGKPAYMDEPRLAGRLGHRHGAAQKVGSGVIQPDPGQDLVRRRQTTF